VLADNTRATVFTKAGLPVTPAFDSLDEALKENRDNAVIGNMHNDRNLSLFS